MTDTTTITVFRGDDVAIAVRVREVVDGVAELYDLTGATVTATLASPSPWTGSGVIIDATRGKLEVQIPAATMKDVTPGTYAADVQVVKGGITRTAAKFNVEVVADVTIP